MRKLLELAGAFIVSVVAVFFLLLALTSCDKMRTPVWTNEDMGPDSVFVAEQIEATMNPYFTSSAEVIEYQNYLIEERSSDEVFLAMPEDVLANVTTVCLKKFEYVTKNDIVDEYRANKSIYDSLSDSASSKKEADAKNKTPVVEEQAQSPKPTSTSYRYETDTVNGKPLKIVIKEERYEN